MEERRIRRYSSMARKITGFTLIEMMVAIGILGIVLAMAVPSYTHWQTERELTSDTKKVLGFMQKQRARAFTTKQKLEISKDGSNKICSSQGECVQTEYIFRISGSGPITISSRGVFKNGNIGIKDDDIRKKYEPRYSCVVLTDTRARLGRYDGSSCSAE